MYEFQVLYAKDKQGKVKIWKASVTMEGDMAVSTIEYGLVDGKRMTARREVTEGKNKGKSNETTPFEQCKAETLRKWLDKRDKEQYTIDIPNDDTKQNAPLFIAPMLAATFDPNSKKRHDIVFPCSIQPKLDGFRCLTYLRDKVVCAQSRTGAFFQMDHITTPLLSFFNEFPTIILDGELYTPDMPFEVIAGLIKTKKRTPEKERDVAMIHYHVYDLVHPDWTFLQRYTFLTKHLLSHPMIHCVETNTVDGFPNVKEAFSRYIREGFEIWFKY